MKKIILSLVGFIVLIILCAGFYFLGDMHAMQSMTIKHVTPDQIATAMKGDYFYNDYRQSTLIVRGQVSSVTKNNETIQLTFKTRPSYKVYCDLVIGTQVPKIGDIITIVSEGDRATRQPDGVLLVDCTI